MSIVDAKMPCLLASDFYQLWRKELVNSDARDILQQWAVFYKCSECGNVESYRVNSDQVALLNASNLESRTKARRVFPRPSNWTVNEGASIRLANSEMDCPLFICDQCNGYALHNNLKKILHTSHGVRAKKLVEQLRALVERAKFDIDD